MKTKVTFKALRRGSIIYKKIPIEHDFKQLPEEEFLGYKFPGQSIESQVIDYLDSIDKYDLMIKYDFDVIIDYFVPRKKKSKDDEIKEFIEYLKPIVKPEEQRQYEAIISEAKDVLFGKGKSNKTKAIEVITMLKMSYKAISGTLSTMMSTINDQKRIS